MADTAMERFREWAGHYVLLRDPDPRDGIRLALEAAPASDLVRELKRRGVLEHENEVHEDNPVDWYRIRPDALDERTGPAGEIVYDIPCGDDALEEG